MSEDRGNTLESLALCQARFMHDERLRDNILDAHLRVKRTNGVLEHELHASSHRHRSTLRQTRQCFATEADTAGLHRDQPKRRPNKA